MSCVIHIYVPLRLGLSFSRCVVDTSSFAYGFLSGRYSLFVSYVGMVILILCVLLLTRPLPPHYGGACNRWLCLRVAISCRTHLTVQATRRTFAFGVWCFTVSLVRRHPDVLNTTACTIMDTPFSPPPLPSRPSAPAPAPFLVYPRHLIHPPYRSRRPPPTFDNAQRFTLRWRD